MTDHTTAADVSPGTPSGARPSGRAHKKQQTRRRLIEAAAEVIAERGFHGASLMDVASRAGLTTGAIYSNFRGKEELFLAVMREVSVGLELDADSQTAWEVLRHAAVVAMRDVELPATRTLHRLQLEFALVAIQEPAILQDFVDDVREDRSELARLLERRDAVPRPDSTPTSEELATAITAALQGLQQHRFLDPGSVPEELAGWVVQALLHAGTPQAGDPLPLR